MQQKIVVLISLYSADQPAILNGLKIASVFQKELCLVYNYSARERKNYDEIKQQLHRYTIPIKNETQNLVVSTLMISEKKSYLPEKLSDDLDAILIIAPSAKFAYHSKSLAESPIPFLFVNTKGSAVPDYKKLILPLDLRKESSESALWASYFGRFNQAVAIVVAASDKGKEEQKSVTKNVVFSKKLFHKFNISHKIYKGTKSSFRNAFEALDLAQSSDSDLLIILGSSTITPLDWIIGLPERKIIEKADRLPVLVINPRKDNYIMCD